MTTSVLTPFGTVRARFYKLENASSFKPSISQMLEEKLQALAGLMEEFRLVPSIVWNAYELVKLQADLTDDEQYLLVLLVLALRMQHAYGSTCLELASDNSVLGKVLKHDLKIENSAQVERDILALLGSTKLPLLVGEPGDYKPLIVEKHAGKKYLYVEQVHDAEGKLIEMLDRFCRASETVVDESTVERYIAEIQASAPDFTIGEKQRHALMTCLDNPLMIISGGPGTGKTTLVFSVLRMLVKHGVSPERIALAAPTGKAANRMGESLRHSFEGLADKTEEAVRLKAIFESAQTMHRLLGYSPARKRFMRDESSQIDADVVIVDEASMMDLSMMQALMRGLKPGARLILLGDAHQLPSVDVGAVFRDLIPKTGVTQVGISTTELTENFRDKSGSGGIIKFAREINHQDAEGQDKPGEVEILGGEYREHLANLRFEKVELIDFKATSYLVSLGTSEVLEAEAERRKRQPHLSADSIKNMARRDFRDDFLKLWFDRHYVLDKNCFPDFMTLKNGQPAEKDDVERLQATFARYQGARVLCLTRKNVTGAETVNRKMHGFYREAFPKLGSGAFLVGEPVMVMKNDYELEVFNGDQGVLIGVGRIDGKSMMRRRHQNTDGRVTTRYVAFPTADPDKFRIIPLGKIAANIELSYAMTVHKSQGSEYAHVALMLPAEEIPLLTREILYTGVTRASVSVTVVGSKEMLEAGARNKTRRVTGLGRR